MQKIIEEFTTELLAKVFMIDMNSARDSWRMMERVIRMCLSKHTGSENPKDVLQVKRMIMSRLVQEVDNPSYYDASERCSVQTCIVVMTREMTLTYVRRSHYAQSRLSDVFKAMNVDVTGAEDYLDGLDQLFTPSQKCVLRLIFGEGCTAVQAAGMLGVTVQEVRSLQWEAMELLQHEWVALKKGGRC